MILIKRYVFGIPAADKIPYIVAATTLEHCDMSQLSNKTSRQHGHSATGVAGKIQLGR